MPAPESTANWVSAAVTRITGQTPPMSQSAINNAASDFMRRSNCIDVGFACRRPDFAASPFDQFGQMPFRLASQQPERSWAVRAHQIEEIWRVFRDPEQNGFDQWKPCGEIIDLGHLFRREIVQPVCQTPLGTLDVRDMRSSNEPCGQCGGFDIRFSGSTACHLRFVNQKPTRDRIWSPVSLGSCIRTKARGDELRRSGPGPLPMSVPLGFPDVLTPSSVTHPVFDPQPSRWRPLPGAPNVAVKPGCASASLSSPPCRVATADAEFSPSPEPGWVRLASSRTNRSTACLRSASGMPGPRSVTLSRT